MKSIVDRLNEAKSSRKSAKYKRKYLSGGGKEFKLRFLSTEEIDVDAAPFKNVWLHGGFFHPNYSNKFPSTFHCVFKDCPLCRIAKEDSEIETATNVPRKEKSAWKKMRRKYSVYWALDLVTNDLLLVHVPDFSYRKDELTLQELLFEKLKSFGEIGNDPFSFDKGHVVSITSKMVNNKNKWIITIDQKFHQVDDEVRARLKELKPLSEVYAQLSKEELEYIAKGKPYKELLQQKAIEVKEELDKDEVEVSEDVETYNEEESLLEGAETTEKKKTSITDKLKNLGNLE